MHTKGINVRHLGVMYCCFANPSWKKRVLTEAVFRVSKNTIQSLMRRAMESLQFVGDEPYIRLIVGYINLLFGDTEESKAYWDKELRWNLQKNFFYIGDCAASLEPIKHDLKQHVDLVRIFEQLPGKLGLEMQPEFMRHVAVKGFFKQTIVVQETDIISIYPIVSSGMTQQPRAFVLYDKAFFTLAKHEDEAYRNKLLLQAIEILAKTAVSESFNHFLTFRLWSKALISLPPALLCQCFPEYLQFTQWLINFKLRHPIRGVSRSTWESFALDFFRDYLWMAVAIYDHLLPDDVITLSSCEKLRRVSIRLEGGDDDFDRVERICHQLAHSCPAIEELELLNVSLATEHLIALSSGGIRNLRKLSVNQIRNTRTQQSGSEIEAAALKTLYLKFPTLTHLTIDNGLSSSEPLLSLCPELGDPALPLEELNVFSKTAGYSTWLKFLRSVKGTLKRVPFLPGDMTDEQVEELADVLEKIEEVNFVNSLISTEGLKRLLPSMTNLQRMQFYVGDGDLGHMSALLPFLPKSMKELTVKVYLEGEEKLKDVEEILELKKDSLPLMIYINAGEQGLVKLTKVLGSDTQIIPGFDGIKSQTCNDGLTSRLSYIQALHWLS